MISGLMNVRRSLGCVFAGRDVDHEQPQRHADLRRGQADARRGVHRLGHVFDERAQLVVEAVTGLPGMRKRLSG